MRNGKMTNIFSGFVLLLIPKCAVCWAAYLGAFGLAGFSALSYRPWFLPVATLLFCFTLGRLLRRSIYSRSYLAFTLAMAGAGLIGWQKWSGSEASWGMPGIALISLAWIIDSKYLSNRFRFTRRPAQ